jgi:signal peptidase I
VNKRVYRVREPQRFEVAVFEYPQDRGKAFVKRVIGLPGDTIQVSDKVVWLNGSRLDEPYVRFAEGSEGRNIPARDNYGPVQIPPAHYFFLGDNRDRSYDSRFWGPVARDKVWGRVQIIYWSWKAAEWSVDWDRLGMPVR